MSFTHRDLKSDERFVYQPPSLWASAFCVALINRETEKLADIYMNLAYKGCVYVIYKRCNCFDRFLNIRCSPGVCFELENPAHYKFWTKECKLFREDIEFAYPQQETTIVHKRLVNYKVEEERLYRVKRRLSFDD